MRKFNHIYLLLLLPIVLLFGCEQEEGFDVNVGPKPTLNTMDLLYELGNYSSFVKAVELTGMQDELTGTEAKTVFAPNDAAFVALLSEMGVDRLEDIPTETLANIVSYHITTGATRSESLPRKLTSMYEGSSIYTVKAPVGTVLNGKALVVQANRTATNGVVQGIGFVLDPPAANLIQEVQSLESEEGPSFTLLLHAIERAGLSGTLTSSANYTLLAPTDEAFAAAGLATTADIDALEPEALASILSYHLLDSARFSQEFSAGRLFTTAGGAGVARGLDVTVGDAVSFSGTPVSSPNHVADNGVVHVVNSLVRPYSYLTETLYNGNPGLVSYYATNAFYQGISQVEGLAEKFEGEAKYHVFSPSNFAVSQLLASLGVSSWAELSDEKITEIVNRHTFDPSLSVTGSVGSKITNALGESYFVTENAEGYSINGAIGEAYEEVAGQLMYLSLNGKYYGNPYFQTSAGIYNGTITTITKSLDRIGAIPAATLTERMLNDPEVDLFAAALASSGLIEENQLYTVFALTNDAFTSATDGLSEAGMLKFLSGHIASGLLFANDLAIDLPEVTTGAGTFNLVHDTDAYGNLTIQDASKTPFRLVNFEDVDNIANNGVYHVIDNKIVY